MLRQQHEANQHFIRNDRYFWFFTFRWTTLLYYAPPRFYKYSIMISIVSDQLSSPRNWIYKIRKNCKEQDLGIYMAERQQTSDFWYNRVFTLFSVSTFLLINKLWSLEPFYEVTGSVENRKNLINLEVDGVSRTLLN